MSVTVVLHHPQDVVNIASVVRAMKNFGLRDLRLVNPEEFSPHRIEGIAHKTSDLLRRVTVHEETEDALADCTYVVGMTARQRRVRRNLARPHAAAAEINRRATQERVALLLGPEDKGLSNEELDLCHQTVVIDTNPDHPSLNLSHAFVIMAHELYRAQGQNPFKSPKRPSTPPTVEALEELFEDATRALDAIEFFKTRDTTRIMRTLREVAHRADLDQREVKLLQAICLEVTHFLDRKGVK